MFYRSKLPKLEMLLEFRDEGLNGCLGVGDYGEVIHIDRHNHLYSIFLINPDTVITSDLFELQFNQELVQQLIPRPVALLQAIDVLEQFKHRVLRTLRESFRMVKIDVSVSISMEECTGDVNRLYLHVLKSTKNQDSSECSPSGSGGKGFSKVKTWPLGKAFGNKPAFIPVH